MTQQEAQSLLFVLQVIRPDVPPKYFDAIVGNPVMRAVELFAQGAVEMKVSPVKPAAASADDAAAQTSPAQKD